MTAQPPASDIDSDLQPSVRMETTVASIPGEQARSQTRQVIDVVILVAVTVIITALIGVFSGEKLLFLEKEQLHLSPGQIGTLNILAALPAYLQPFMGAWSDLFPLFGYRRRSYYVIAALVETLGFLGLAVLHPYHYAAVVGLILVYGAGGTLLWVMVNAVMVAVGNQTGTLPRLQSVRLFIPYILFIAFAASLSGYVTQYWSYYSCFMVAALLSFFRAPFALLIDEKRMTGARHAHETDEEHRARLAAKQAERARTAEALRKAAATPGLWAMVGFVFYLILTPGVYTAQIFYETDVLHFSKQFIGELGRYLYIGALLGVLLFGATSKRLPVRAMVWGAWIIDCVSYPILLYLHDPTSAKIVQLSTGFIGALYTLGLWTLAAHASPPGIEGTVYGLVLGAISLGGTLSEKIGGTLYDYFGPMNTAHHYSIAHGWVWAVWFGLIFTLIAVVFIPFLPDWTKSNEPIHASVEPEGGTAIEGGGLRE
ncbi:MAG TPA: MFS transporter [Chthonomonadaceae bacterium]|nr:MFS transporter [Chthonomonadaceae bacterium]